MESFNDLNKVTKLALVFEILDCNLDIKSKAVPQLSPETVVNLHGRLQKVLEDKYSGWDIEGNAIGVGGSAAVFRVSMPGSGSKAFKLLDPKFSCGEFAGAAEKRIELQRQFIGHDCPALIQFHEIFKFDEVYVTVMEDLPWDELKDHIRSIPSENIIPLIGQIVEVIQFLELKGMVHRDLKPENILISPDKSEVRIIDLGVLREISPEEDRMDLTDFGDHRPFLATAQYSSPEYLFRTKEPSKDLWKALNIYQLGAIVYDLINGFPIFSSSMAMGNRYALALDVLSQKPIISQKAYNDFPGLAKLCDRSLIKDPILRLDLVSIEEFLHSTERDFQSEIEKSLRSLEQIEERREGSLLDNKVDREQALNTLCEELRENLLTQYSPNLQFEVSSINSEPRQIRLIVVMRGNIEICSHEIEMTPPVDGRSSLHKLVLIDTSSGSSVNMTGAFDISGSVDPTLYAQISECIESSIIENIDKISEQLL